jgi:hypothetical protein
VREERKERRTVAGEFGQELQRVELDVLHLRAQEVDDRRKTAAVVDRHLHVICGAQANFSTTFPAMKRVSRKRHKKAA